MKRFAPLALLVFAAACGGNTNNTGNDLTALRDFSVVADMTATPPDMVKPADLIGTMADLVSTAKIVKVGEGGFSFSPATLTISAGDTVRWVWSSGSHNVVSGVAGTPDNKFCSDTNTNCGSAPTFGAGHTYEFKFSTAGAYPYFCAPHAGAGMVGSITVQ